MQSAGPIAPARSGVFLAGNITIQPLAVDTPRSTGAEYAMPPASTFSGTVLRAERAGEDSLALHLMVRPATWSTPRIQGSHRPLHATVGQVKPLSWISCLQI